MATKRHKWQYERRTGHDVCADCWLQRRRPMSAIRRGRASVSDWDYLVDGEWRRLQRVPVCEPIDKHVTS